MIPGIGLRAVVGGGVSNVSCSPKLLTPTDLFATGKGFVFVVLGYRANSKASMNKQEEL